MSAKCFFSLCHKVFLCFLICGFPAVSFAQGAVPQSEGRGYAPVQDVNWPSSAADVSASIVSNPVLFSAGWSSNATLLSPTHLAFNAQQCLQEAKKALEYCIVELAKDKAYCHGRYAVRVRQCNQPASSL